MGTVKKTVNYKYEKDNDTGWNNLLTGVDLDGNGTYGANEKIDYDEIGNPTNYLGNDLSWFGRQLRKYSGNGNTISYTYDADGYRATKTVNGAKTTYRYVNGQLVYESRSDGRELFYLYDSYGKLTSIRTYNGDASTLIGYYVTTNAQGDVVGIYNSEGVQRAAYEYDAWGNVISVTDGNGNAVTSSTHIANLNSIRYRSYYLDKETGLYYVGSRYYNPQVGRWLNADTTSLLTATPMGMTDKNLFAYCDNNPVVRVDCGGQFWETAFDVISLTASIVEVCANPADVWAWAGLIGDAVDLIPFVTGVGEVTRVVKTTAKAVYKATDVVDAAKTIYKTADAASDIHKATGSYEILYKSGKNYIGKGGFERAITSAIEHAKPNKLNNMMGDSVLSITWTKATDKNQAFINEYLWQQARGGVLSFDKTLKTYNKIWSPGRNLLP